MSDTVETETKKWQYGVDIQYLKEISEFFTESDGDVLKSPFTEMTKPSIAKALHENNLIIEDGYYIVAKEVKTKNSIKDFSGNIITTRKKGDLYIPRFAYSTNEVFSKINELSKGRDTWVTVWQEKKREVDNIEKLGFKRVCTKITSHAEILGIYYKGDSKIKDITDSQKATLKYVRDVNVKDIIKELDNEVVEYTNHFSNYNPVNSWSALSLRGYLSDYTFISKPDVMSNKWTVENKEDYKLQYTDLWNKLPSVKKLLDKTFPEGTQYDRIRLMKLDAKVGVLERHSDKTEKNAGVDDGRLARFHFPLYTNEEVKFEMWDLEGNHINEHLKVGELWYLDMRKPHRASNLGDTNRVHLVVDVISNEGIREMLGDERDGVDDLFE